MKTAILLLLLAFPFSNAFTQSKDSITIVCFGNSTSVPRKNINKIYPYRLQDSLNKINLFTKIILSAVGGSHVGSIKDNSFHKIKHGMDRFMEEVIPTKPNWVIISFGINDAWQDKGKDSLERIPLEKYLQNLNYYIDELEKINSKIILLTPNPIGEKYETWRYDNLQKYALATKDLAKKRNIISVDVWHLFQHEALLKNKSVDSLLLDGMHPNDSGHALIANALFLEISKQSNWIHPKANNIKGLKLGPFIHLKDGSILTVDSTDSYISNNQGKTWTKYPLFNGSNNFLIREERALIRTKSGTIILAFVNEKERKNWNWNNQTHDAPEAELPTYSIRSVDGGKTWSNLQKLHKDWTGAIRDMVETRDGAVVFTSMIMRHNPGHHTVVTYTTNDEGIHWVQSNSIDLGGIGNHAGIMEATLTPLNDGRLWMLMRTNWGKFWEAYSSNNGLIWTDIKATTIDASSAPGMVKRLKSGRLILIWNRYFPEGKKEYPLKGGDNNWSEVAVSNQREELSMMFSDTDGKTWNSPIVIAKTYSKESQISYPYVFENKPGELWITTMYGGLRIAVTEADFTKTKQEKSTENTFGMRMHKAPTTSSKIYEPVVLHAAPSNESSIIQYPDGIQKIFFINRPGFANQMMSITSLDSGIHWSDPVKEFDLPGEAYYANRCYLDAKGTLHSVFHIYGIGRNGYRGKHLNLWYAKKVTGKKWSKPKKIVDGYVGSIRGFIQLKNNRLLIPMSEADSLRTNKPASGETDYGLFSVICVYSDDDGVTWKKSNSTIKIAVESTQVTRYGAVEPNVIALNNGKLWMLIRTNKGHLFETFSSDGGNNWNEATRSKFISSDSPAELIRLKNKNILLLWSSNQRYDNTKSYANGGREVLHAAISTNDAATWQGFREVLVSPEQSNTKGDRGSAYPSAIESLNGKIIFVSGQSEERAIVGFDPNYLLEKKVSSNFNIGLDQFTLYGNKHAKLAIVNNGTRVLHLQKIDSTTANAVWNFPMKLSGTIQLKLNITNLFKGLTLTLTNHYSVPFDSAANKNAGIYFAYNKNPSKKTNNKLIVTLRWNHLSKSASLWANSQLIKTIKYPTQNNNGFNYLRIGLPENAQIGNEIYLSNILTN